MKKKFSKEWKGSSKARKQRKYRFNAPLHLKQRFMSSNLSKELRKTHGRRSIELRKNDVVRVLSGKFRNKKGKIIEIDSMKERATIEGIQITKKDGSKVNLTFHPSKLQITELNTDDKKRLKKKIENKKTGEKQEKK